MQGIVITGKGTFEYREDIAVPQPGPGEVRIKVLAAGICGTDIHITRGDESLMSMITPPVVLGHEFCGEVDSWGEGVTAFEKGEYVSAEMHEVCFTCRACVDQKQHACEKTKIHGLQLDGAFAEYVVVSAKNVVKLPRSIPIKVAAFMDALGNAVHTVCKTQLAERVVSVIGYGPIGAMACEVALFEKASHLFIVDISDKALQRAQEWAVKKGHTRKVTVIDGRDKTAGRNIYSFSGGGCDACFDCCGAQAGINLAFSIVRPGGEISLLGIPKGKDIVIHDYPKNMILKGVTVYGIIGREMFRTWEKMISLFREGLDVADLVTAEYPLKDFATGLSRFADGDEQKVILYPGK